MPTPIAKVARGWEYGAAEAAALALEGLLARHGITIAPGSAFEAHVLSVLRLVAAKRSGGAKVLDDDVRDQYRTLIGVYELAVLVLAVENAPGFASLVPHLRLLNHGEALQNTPSGGSDQATNKLFELYMGAVALQCGDNVALDDPGHSMGTNPDVLFTAGSRRWGIACKVLHGKHPEGFVEHLTKGLDQIDASEAEVGVVAFNLKNVLLHGKVWPLAPLNGVPGASLVTGYWVSPEAPFRILLSQMEQLGGELASYLPSGHLDTLFAGRKSIPAFLLWGASPSGVIINGKPSATSVRAMIVKNVGTLAQEDMEVLKCLSSAIYTDSAGRGARPQLSGCGLTSA